ncbi:MAG: UDP-N-acetylmuramate--L-alanine ligase [Ruminococcaceae bacterium]|nr:UDP-N-acetylmuramate--L-alanine ligase [Oscillospiraceae bacterium]
MASSLDNIRRVHFVGIGGSGMSPLAEILHELGFSISGSDWGESDNIHRLAGLGIPIFKGHFAENVGDSELVVYTSAVSGDNPELVAAKERGIPTIERGMLLGEISRRYGKTVAVAGTHGKTTTSSMLSHTLLKADIDPSVFIGGRLPLIGANGRAGKSDIMVCEACEFQDHYLSMRPAIGIILNVDADHLEYFGSLEGVIASFNKFSHLCDTLIINADDENTRKAVDGIDKTIITCGLTDGCEWQAKHIVFTESYGSYDCWHNGAFFAHITLGVPGEHNVLNSLTAVAAAVLCGATAEQIANGIADFHGAGRRFEFLGTFAGVTVADDYAHHPTEITATLTAAKAMGYKRVWAIFQPFTFSRTARHLDDFAKALSLADTAVVSDIMGSREHNTWNVHSDQITAKMENGVYIPAFPEITDYILQNVQEGDLVVTMGGGNVYYCARMIVEKLKEV